MKYTFTAAILIGFVAAQQLADLPQCGQTCISNMLAQAGPLGCPDKGGQPDAACLCANANFGYGVRDCTIQACPSGTDTNSIIAYGLAYCADVASSASGSGTSLVATSALTATGTATGAVGGASGASDVSASAITTRPVVETRTSGGSTFETTVGSTTIYSGASGAAASVTTIISGGSTIISTLTGAAGSAAGSASSAVSGASGSAESAASSASSAASGAGASASSAASGASASASSAVGSATSAAGSATSAAGSAASGSSSGFAAPMATAAVHGLAGVVGLAAVMML